MNGCSLSIMTVFGIFNEKENLEDSFTSLENKPIYFSKIKIIIITITIKIKNENKIN